MYLKELSQIHGVSGNEHEVRNYIKSIVESYVDDIKVDSIGNLICFKKGTKSSKKILLVAHMDEVGFMVTSIMKNWLLKFTNVGGIDPKTLPGKKVLVGKNKIKGIIGLLPIHLQNSTRFNNISITDLYIDIGVNHNIVKGDYISFDSKYEEYNHDIVKGKAFDDRVGCSLLIDILEDGNLYEYDLYVCFSVQEEIGLRGAKILGYCINPDIALIVEGTTCVDVTGVREHECSTSLGEGAVLTRIDRTSYFDRDFVQYIYDTAIENGIKVQFKNTCTGGNDAGNIQREKGGSKTGIISLPVRYLHTPSSIISLYDYKCCYELLRKILLKV